jgi:thiopurine S-methyltransferase
MAEDWLSRWEEGRIGWHEADGNASLKEHWPELPHGSRVLVPLCGKSPDVLWLGSKGHSVTGVELSEIAVRSFLDEASLEFTESENGGLKIFRCADPDVTMVCGDYFSFTDDPFDAVYDRASLIALPSQIRPAYARHTTSLLKPGAGHLLVTLEYVQEAVGGPPFSVLADEVRSYWDHLERVSERNAIDGCPPKFRNAGLTDVTEVVWVSR